MQTTIIVAFLLAIAGYQLSRAKSKAIASVVMCLLRLASQQFAMEEEEGGHGTKQDGEIALTIKEKKAVERFLKYIN